MHKLTDLIVGHGGISSGTGENMRNQSERLTPVKRIDPSEERVYQVTWIVPAEAVMIDEGRVIVRVKVVANNDHMAMYRADVRTRLD